VRGSQILIEPWQPVALRWNGTGAADGDGQVRYSGMILTVEDVKMDDLRVSI
jgi:hypothetical protein